MKTLKISDANLSMLIAVKNSFGGEILYDMYGRAVWLVIIRLVPDKDAAEKILLEAYSEFWTAFKCHSTEKLLTRLLKIVRRRCKEFNTKATVAA